MSRRDVDAAEVIDFDLDDEARRILSRGLKEWGGPARCTEEMATAMGFSSVVDLFAEGDRISRAIRSRRPLTRHDWARALLATEIVFASSDMGAGLDWSIVTGFSDIETISGCAAHSERSAEVSFRSSARVQSTHRWLGGRQRTRRRLGDP